VRVIFLNRYFFPDHSATAQILSDLAFHLSERGEHVAVITGRQLYDDPGATLPRRESLRGVDVHRVSASRFGRHSLIGRGIDYASFYVASAISVLRVAKRGDVVVAKTDPPMLSVLVSLLAPLKGYRTVNWLHDVYPEVAGELGISGLKGRFGRILARARNASLSRATMNVAIGEDMARRICGMGIPRDRMLVVANWTDDEEIRPSDAAANPLRREWSLEGKFVVAYSGNLGRAHDIETVLNAAEHLRERSDIVFLFVGGGRGLRDLEAEARKRQLESFVFRPYQPRERLSLSLGVADVHWLSLKAGLDGLLLPSKFYGIAAAGRPMLIIGSPEGEFAKLAAEHACGFAVSPGNGDELARVIASLAANPVRLQQMGENARRMLDRGLTKSQALTRWRAILSAAAGASTP
jgi:glycosyltransferase involved in cell wall biosynthesis